MSWLLMEKLLRHQQSVRSSEGCCVDRLNSPGRSRHRVNIAIRSLLTHNVTSRPSIVALRETLVGDKSYLLWLDDFPRQIVPNTTVDESGYKLNFL